METLINNSDRDESVTLTVKGLITLALGGFVGEENGLNTFENTDKVMTALSSYLHRNNYAITSINGELKFLPINKSRGKRKWYKFWQ